MSSPTRPERGGAARVTAHGDPGVQATPGSFGAAPVVPGFSFAVPPRRWGRRLLARASGFWQVIPVQCQCLGQPRGPLGHPQPAPRGSGSTRLPEPPARQGALNRGSRWDTPQPPAPWDIGQIPSSSWTPVSPSGDCMRCKVSALSILVSL